MRNIRLTIEYDGSRYQGWGRPDRDNSAGTISGKIRDVIQKMTDEQVDLFCGMRTEAGIHAYGQVANFKTDTDMSVTEIQRYLNRYLPMDIAITDTKEMPERFHSRLHAISATYVYRISVSSVASVFDRKYTYHCFCRPDREIMDKAGHVLTGRHDFASFSTGRQAKSTVKEIQKIEIYEDMEEVQITIVANDFLHNMQRMITGTLIDIGVGARPLNDVFAIFAGKARASAPCDPKGMYLQEILYEE